MELQEELECNEDVPSLSDIVFRAKEEKADIVEALEGVIHIEEVAV